MPFENLVTFYSLTAASLSSSHFNQEGAQIHVFYLIKQTVPLRTQLESMGTILPQYRGVQLFCYYKKSRKGKLRGNSCRLQGI